MLATANTGEVGRGLKKMQVNGPRGVEISKEEIAVSVAGVAIY